ncbi:hypothetical protein [Asaia lannensis]|uniref:hypothetical protein n=1 Tax=Asaia lannensis TaxID=415421 RepID=UPI003872DEE4
MALLQIGVGAMGTGASAADIASGVMHLNMMLAKWQQQKFIVPNLVDMPLMSTGASVYYLGPGGDFDVSNRPSRLDGAYARLATGVGFQQTQTGDFSDVNFSSTDFDTGTDGLQSPSTGGPLDFPLKIISSYEEYAAIGLKGLRTWPNAVYYNPAYPLGELRFFPIPQSGVWELHIITRASLPAALTPESAIDLPTEYWDALMWNLAVRIAPSYGQDASPVAQSMARSALTTLRSVNQQIPRVQMPATVGSTGAAAVNPWWIYSGGF